MAVNTDTTTNTTIKQAMMVSCYPVKLKVNPAALLSVVSQLMQKKELPRRQVTLTNEKRHLQK